MRESFKCVHCGLVLHGTVASHSPTGAIREGGTIKAYDRSATKDSEPRPCICTSCKERKSP